MQGTTDFHDYIGPPFFQESDRLFEYATAFHTAHHLVDPSSSPRHLPIGLVLLGRQRFPSGFFGRLDALHPVQGECLKAQVLQQGSSRGKGIRRFVSKVLVGHSARLGITQKHHG